MWISTSACLTAQQSQRLDNFFGFREFKLKTMKENYSGYEMKRIDLYNMPDNIISVYSIPYTQTIGNTKVEELHLFFLGNRLVRVIALLKDSLHLSYLKKSFGEGIAPSPSLKIKEPQKETFAQTGKTYFFNPVCFWREETVYLEEKWIYYQANNKKEAVTKKMCLDLYLKEFSDLLYTLTKELK